MKTVYYVGYYCGSKTGKRVIKNTNPAGTLKMNFVIKSMKKLGYKVCVISVAPDDRNGFHSIRKINIDDLEEHIYLPSIMIRIKGKRRGTGISVRFLQDYIKKHITKNDTVLSYHSLGYSKELSELHGKIGFKWIPQIEEIYCLSRGELKDNSFLLNEEAMFDKGDGYLFVNDIFPNKYSNGKPFAVSYGNYSVYKGERKRIGNNINIAYTGIINDDRGAFLMLDAMKLLPEKYRLNVLGFGSESNMDRFMKTLSEINEKSGYEKIKFLGTKSGEEYSEFLIDNQIGLSLMDTSEDISANAFPSKIMSYLGHGLSVVSSKTDSICKSKVADMLYFCDNTAQSIVDAIMAIDVYKNNEYAKRIEALEERFVNELEKVLQDK